MEYVFIYWVLLSWQYMICIKSIIQHALVLLNIWSFLWTCTSHYVYCHNVAEKCPLIVLMKKHATYNLRTEHALFYTVFGESIVGRIFQEIRVCHVWPHKRYCFAAFVFQWLCRGCLNNLRFGISFVSFSLVIND